MAQPATGVLEYDTVTNRGSSVRHSYEQGFIRMANSLTEVHLYSTDTNSGSSVQHSH